MSAEQRDDGSLTLPAGAKFTPLPAPDWSLSDDQAATIERKAYCQGWWWGFASGLICGSCSVGLLAFLLWTLAKALGLTC